MLTPAQIQFRRTGLGGSDAAVVLGRSPWRGQFEVWHEKRTGEVVAPKPEQLTRWAVGHAVEPVIVEALEACRFIARDEETRELKKALTAGEASVDPGLSCVRSPDLEYAIANTDRSIYTPAGKGVLELKNSDSMAFRKAWSGGVPEYYLAQLQHYMFVTGLDFAVIAALEGNSKVHAWHIKRDDVFIHSELVPALKDFWRLVQVGERPNVDDKASTKAALDLFFGQREKGIELDLRGDDQADRLLELGHEIVSEKFTRKTADKRLALLNNQARAITGKATEVLLDDGFVFHWQASGRGHTAVLKEPEA